jgi:MoxR-like ATPase
MSIETITSEAAQAPEAGVPDAGVPEEKEAAASFDSQVAAASEAMQRVLVEVGKVIVGQTAMLQKVMVALLSNGHVLLEGVPGLAKTLTVRTLSDAVQGKHARVQFTPDLLPSDLVGTMVYNQNRGEFSCRFGPVFANLVLADEINRAPAKVQSALLEAMQERQVTIGDTSYPLPVPFLVMATQNPIEQEGTYPLPEAQLDRFMMRVLVGYPTRTEERTMLDRMIGAPPSVAPVASLDDVSRAQALVKNIHLNEKLKDYIVDLVQATRHPRDHKGLRDIAHYIQHGASPRATLALSVGARASAFLKKRSYVTPDDVKSVAVNVLAHRIIRSYEAQAENVNAESLVGKILDVLPVP